MLSRLREWLKGKVISALFLVAAIFWAWSLHVAQERGLSFGVVTGTLANVGVIVGALAFLGLQLTFIEASKTAARRWIQKAPLGLVALMFATAVALLSWAHGRVEVRLHCTPGDTTVLIDGHLYDGACKAAEIWTSKGNLYAFRDGYTAFNGSASGLPEDEGVRTLELPQLARYQCVLKDAHDDPVPFVACGQTDTSWTRSRTWRMEIRPRDHEAASGLEVTSTQPATGIAIRATSDSSNCYSRAGVDKPPLADSIDLDGCAVFRDSGGVDYYQVDVTLCVATPTSSEIISTWIVPTIVTPDGERHDLKCEPPNPSLHDSRSH